MYFVTRGYIAIIRAIVLDGDNTLKKVIRDDTLVNNRIRYLDTHCAIYINDL